MTDQAESLNMGDSALAESKHPSSRERELQVLVDTNLFLHYKRPDQLDWSTCGDAKARVLVVLPCVVRELEKAKVAGLTPRVRQRAAAIIKWLGSFLSVEGPIEIRRDLWLTLHGDEARLDLEALHLDRSFPDDLLLAGAIERLSFQSEVLIATGDMGLKVKCRQRRIAFWTPSEADELAEEPTEEQVKLRQAQRELQLLRDRMPHLAVNGIVGDGVLFAKQFVLPPEPPSLGEVERRVPPVVNLEAPREMSGETAKLMSSLVDMVSRFSNQRTAGYLQQYRDFLEHERAWRSLATRTIELPLFLENKGTARATDIEVILEFPRGCSILTSSELLERPKEPVPPLDATGQTLTFSQTQTVLAMHMDGSSEEDDVRMHAHGHRLFIRLKHLMHSRRFNLGSVWLVFPDGTLPSPVSANTRILMAESGHEAFAAINVVPKG